MKDFLSLRPVRHHRIEKRVRGHVVLCVPGLRLSRRSRPRSWPRLTCGTRHREPAKIRSVLRVDTFGWEKAVVSPAA